MAANQLDRVSHTKAVLVGPSVQIPITDGRLNLGNWQGMYQTDSQIDPSTEIHLT